MGQIAVYVDASEVLDEVSDKELLAECRDRKLDGQLDLEGGRRDDLVRALNRKDWPEVDYLLRTYFLRNEMRTVLPPQMSRDPATGRPVIQ